MYMQHRKLQLPVKQHAANNHPRGSGSANRGRSRITECIVCRRCTYPVSPVACVIAVRLAVEVIHVDVALS
jgi:hypothetical protein